MVRRGPPRGRLRCWGVLLQSCGTGGFGVSGVSGDVAGDAMIAWRGFFPLDNSVTSDTIVVEGLYA